MSGSGTILVTGGAGYVGSHTCKELAANGYRPVVYDNLSEGHAEFVKWGELVEGDIADTKKLVETFENHRPAAVVHFAASAYVGASVADPQFYYDNNLKGSLSLLSAMRETHCNKLVFSSTCAVYGATADLPITTATPAQPISPYGRSKWMIEQVLQDVASAHEINSVCLRYFNAAGADLEGQIGERHVPETHLIPNTIAAAMGAGEPLLVFGNDYPTADGTCIRDYVHVTDLARGHVRALEFMHQHSGKHAFNLGGGVGASVMEVIRAVEAHLDTAVPFNVMPRRSGDPAELVADISETSNALGWKPELSDLNTIIKSAVAWANKEIN